MWCLDNCDYILKKNPVFKIACKQLKKTVIDILVRDEKMRRNDEDLEGGEIGCELCEYIGGWNYYQTEQCLN